MRTTAAANRTAGVLVLIAMGALLAVYGRWLSGGANALLSRSGRGRSTSAHRLGALRWRASLPLSAPWTVLFGPSGSGKSTILRRSPGWYGPEAGRVSVSGHQR